MGTTFTLAPIVRQIESPSNAKPIAGDALYSYNAKTGKFLPAPPKLQKLKPWLDMRYFIVNDEAVARRENQEVYLYDFHQQAGISLTISYELSLLTGASEQLVQRIVNENNPTHCLEKIIEKEIKRIFKEDIRALGRVISMLKDADSGIRRNLVRAIADLVESEFGLSIELRIGMRNPDEVENHRFRIEDLELITADNARISLTFDIELAMDNQDYGRTLLMNRRLKELEQRARSNIRDTFLELIDLRAVNTELETGVRSLLMQNIDQIAADWGRKVAVLNLLHLHAPKPEYPTMIEYQVDCKILDMESEVRIETKLHTTLFDHALYHRIGTPNVKEWAERELTESIRNILFKINYRQLVLKLNKLKKQIEKEMNQKAEAIGFKIKQLMVVPNLEPFNLLKRFEDTRQNDFKTAQPNVLVPLEVSINGRIKDFSKIEEDLRPDVQILDGIIWPAVNRTIQQEISAVSTERTFLGYEVPLKGEEALRDVIEKSIMRQLKALGMRKPVVRALMTNSIFSQRFRELTAKEQQLDLEIHITPEGATEVGGKETYRLMFRITGIHPEIGWPRFQEQVQRDVADVNESIKRLMREHLTGQMEHIYPMIDSLGPEAGKAIKKTFKSLKKLIAATFGLEVQFLNIRQLKSKLSNKRIEKLTELKERKLLLEISERYETQEARVAQIKEEREALARMRKEFIRNEDFDDAKRIKKQIRKLDKEMDEILNDTVDHARTGKGLGQGEAQNYKALAFEISGAIDFEQEMPPLLAENNGKANPGTSDSHENEEGTVEIIIEEEG